MHALPGSSPLRRPFRSFFTLVVPALCLALATVAPHAGAEQPAAEGEGPAEGRVTPAGTVGLEPVIVIDRKDIEMSGHSTVWELLSSRSSFNSFGQYRATFGAGASIVVNGRSIAGINYWTLPLSAVERVEILDIGPVRYGAGGAAGTINIVLRNDFEGAEVSGGIGRPTQPGRDANHAGALWGGTLGSTRVTIGVEHHREEEIRQRDREHSRADWTPGGSFSEATGISSSGNTIVFQEHGARALGDCDEGVYTGILSTPQGEVCAYPYADIAWTDNYDRRDRESLFVHAEHPFSDDSDFYVEARVARGDSLARYAPSVGSFEFAPEGAVRDYIANAVQNFAPADFPDERIRVRHRFVGHGNREWRAELEEYDLKFGVEGRLGGGLVYDAHAEVYRSETVTRGSTFVSERLAREAIESGRYDIVNPLSPNLTLFPGHRDAVRDMSLRLHRDTVNDRKRASATIGGSADTPPAHELHWTAGIEVAEVNYRDVHDYRDSEGRSHEVDDVLGSGGESIRGDRTRVSLMAEATAPLVEGWDATLGARLDTFNDVDDAATWRAATRFRPNDMLELRASWDRAARPPSFSDLHSPQATSFPRACDPAPPHCEQVEMVTGGNPDLVPDDVERFSIGATAKLDPVSLAVDWFRVEISDIPGVAGVQDIVDRERAGNPIPGTRVVRHGGQIDEIYNPTVQTGESESTGIALHAGADWEMGGEEYSLDVHGFRTLRHESRQLGVPSPYEAPKNRLHAVLRASWGDVTASWNFHWISSHPNLTRTGRFAPWSGHDVALGWRNAFGIDGMSLWGGVLNLADRGPVLDPTMDEAPDLYHDAIRGRTVFVKAAMEW